MVVFGTILFTNYGKLHHLTIIIIEFDHQNTDVTNGRRVNGWLWIAYRYSFL